jgi:anti-anti-sigma factor
MIFRQDDRSILLQPKGKLDIQQSAAFQQQIASVEPKAHYLWIVDLSHVDFIDSAGLAALAAGLKLARKNHCRFVLCNLHPSVRILLEITGLDDVFEIVKAPAEAIAAGSSSVPEEQSAATLVAA